MSECTPSPADLPHETDSWTSSDGRGVVWEIGIIPTTARRGELCLFDQELARISEMRLNRRSWITGKGSKPTKGTKRKITT